MNARSMLACGALLAILAACTGKQAPPPAGQPGNDVDTGAIGPAETGSDTDANSDADAVTDADANADADAVTDADAKADADAVTEGDAVTAADADAITDAEVAMDAVTDVDTGADTDTETDADAGADVPPWTLPEICKDDGIGPGPAPGAPCSVEGEMRCIDNDAVELKTYAWAPSPQVFCARPHFVRCLADGLGKLRWTGDACALVSDGWKKGCFTAPEWGLQWRACKVYKSQAHCCPYFFEGDVGQARPCADSEHGTTVCHYLEGKQYGAGKSVCTTPEEVVLKAGEQFEGGYGLDSLDKCKAGAAGCMYWFNINRKSPDNLACWDPKKPYHEDGSHLIYPKRGCIVKDGKVVWAQSCVEMGYWEYGGPGKP